MIVTTMLEKHELTFPEGVSVNQKVIDLLKKILNKNPAERPTFAEIVKDPWFDEVRAFEQTLFEEEDMFEEEETKNGENEVPPDPDTADPPAKN